MSSEKLHIRPYARLLTMLGDQLIRNERIALVELIKNGYDADAEWVEVRFEHFLPGMKVGPQSTIVVADNGCGMTVQDIRDAWMNPATPHKMKRRRDGYDSTPKKGRIVQGEKGIGRFAVLKLGNKVTVTTKTENSSFESILSYDFTRFDDEFTTENSEEKDIYLDEIEVDYSESTTPESDNSSSGTQITIQNLKGSWNHRIIGDLYRDVSSLTDPISRISKHSNSEDFSVTIICNGKPVSVENESVDGLRSLIEDKAVLKIRGRYESTENKFIYSINGNEKQTSLNNPKILGLWLWKQRYRSSQDSMDESRPYECGTFKFQFYVFDFSRNISGKFALNQTEKNILKEHRIYLYRDEVRVFPYGNYDDDWLNIDISRGTGRAGHFFSNDQLLGWIDISQKDNPRLRDKTNREGLIEEGNATSDFLFLIPLFLSYVKQRPYLQYQHKQLERNLAETLRNEVVANHIEEMKSTLEAKGYKPEVVKLSKLAKDYEREKKFLVQRAEVTEDLAGVGLSVEMTSHDIMLLMGRAKDIGIEISRQSKLSGSDGIQKQADMLIGVLTQIVEGMHDIQSLFKSAKRRKRALRIEPILDKIFQLYRSLLDKRSIRYEKVVESGSPLVADTTDGVVMQVLINLFDNSSYWLDTLAGDDKLIRVELDGENGELIFADNGPGVEQEDAPYIFDAFYSGKGQEGRGLGLYIAKQLLDRHDYGISLSDNRKGNLAGAKFVVSFLK